MQKVKSAYIHIPFCNDICSYCDFCKMYYNKQMVDDYIVALGQEIKKKYRHEVLSTLYIGGGSPSSLTIEQLSNLFNVLSKFVLDPHCEITFECNVSDMTESKLDLLRRNGVNRLSIGVETSHPKYIRLLNRHHTKAEVVKMISLARKKGFKNINVDLIYALFEETLEQLEEDLKFLYTLNIEHISTYSLMIEEHTKLYLSGYKPIEEELDEKMYQFICSSLEQHGFHHYEISNFSKDGFDSKHNLTYWNNLEYYGFGLGASGYIDSKRYTNTQSLNHYIKGSYVYEEEKLTKLVKMQNEFILGLRKINGICKDDFFKKYKQSVTSIPVVMELLERKLLEETATHIYIPKDKMYVSNQILYHFL